MSTTGPTRPGEDVRDAAESGGEALLPREITREEILRRLEGFRPLIRKESQRIVGVNALTKHLVVKGARRKADADFDAMMDEWRRILARTDFPIRTRAMLDALTRRFAVWTRGQQVGVEKHAKGNPGASYAVEKSDQITTYTDGLFTAMFAALAAGEPEPADPAADMEARVRRVRGLINDVTQDPPPPPDGDDPDEDGTPPETTDLLTAAKAAYITALDEINDWDPSDGRSFGAHEYLDQVRAARSELQWILLQNDEVRPTGRPEIVLFGPDNGMANEGSDHEIGTTTTSTFIRAFADVTSQWRQIFIFGEVVLLQGNHNAMRALQTMRMEQLQAGSDKALYEHIRASVAAMGMASQGRYISELRRLAATLPFGRKTELWDILERDPSSIAPILVELDESITFLAPRSDEEARTRASKHLEALLMMRQPTLKPGEINKCLIWTDLPKERLAKVREGFESLACRHRRAETVATVIPDAEPPRDSGTPDGGSEEPKPTSFPGKLLFDRIGVLTQANVGMALSSPLGPPETVTTWADTRLYLDRCLMTVEGALVLPKVISADKFEALKRETDRFMDELADTYALTGDRPAPFAPPAAPEKARAIPGAELRDIIALAAGTVLPPGYDPGPADETYTGWVEVTAYIQAAIASAADWCRQREGVDRADELQWAITAVLLELRERYTLRGRADGRITGTQPTSVPGAWLTHRVRTAATSIIGANLPAADMSAPVTHWSNVKDCFDLALTSAELRTRDMTDGEARLARLRHAFDLMIREFGVSIGLAGTPPTSYVTPGKVIAVPPADSPPPRSAAQAVTAPVQAAPEKPRTISGTELKELLALSIGSVVGAGFEPAEPAAEYGDWMEVSGYLHAQSVAACEWARGNRGMDPSHEMQVVGPTVIHAIRRRYELSGEVETVLEGGRQEGVSGDGVRNRVQLAAQATLGTALPLPTAPIQLLDWGQVRDLYDAASRAAETHVTAVPATAAVRRFRRALDLLVLELHDIATLAGTPPTSYATPGETLIDPPAPEKLTTLPGAEVRELVGLAFGSVISGYDPPAAPATFTRWAAVAQYLADATRAATAHWKRTLGVDLNAELSASTTSVFPELRERYALGGTGDVEMSGRLPSFIAGAKLTKRLRAASVHVMGSDFSAPIGVRIDRWDQVREEFDALIAWAEARVVGIVDGADRLLRLRRTLDLLVREFSATVRLQGDAPTSYVTPGKSLTAAPAATEIASAGRNLTDGQWEFIVSNALAEAPTVIAQRSRKIPDQTERSRVQMAATTLLAMLTDRLLRAPRPLTYPAVARLTDELAQDAGRSQAATRSTHEHTAKLFDALRTALAETNRLAKESATEAIQPFMSPTALNAILRKTPAIALSGMTINRNQLLRAKIDEMARALAAQGSISSWADFDAYCGDRLAKLRSYADGAEEGVRLYVADCIRQSSRAMLNVHGMLVCQCAFDGASDVREELQETVGRKPTAVTTGQIADYVWRRGFKDLAPAPATGKLIMDKAFTEKAFEGPEVIRSLAQLAPLRARLRKQVQKASPNDKAKTKLEAAFDAAWSDVQAFVELHYELPADAPTTVAAGAPPPPPPGPTGGAEQAEQAQDTDIAVLRRLDRELLRVDAPEEQNADGVTFANWQRIANNALEESTQKPLLLNLISDQATYLRLRGVATGLVRRMVTELKAARPENRAAVDVLLAGMRGAIDAAEAEAAYPAEPVPEMFGRLRQMIGSLATQYQALVDEPPTDGPMENLRSFQGTFSQFNSINIQPDSRTTPLALAVAKLKPLAIPPRIDDWGQFDALADEWIGNIDTFDAETGGAYAGYAQDLRRNHSHTLLRMHAFISMHRRLPGRSERHDRLLALVERPQTSLLVAQAHFDMSTWLKMLVLRDDKEAFVGRLLNAVKLPDGHALRSRAEAETYKQQLIAGVRRMNRYVEPRSRQTLTDLIHRAWSNMEVALDLRYDLPERLAPATAAGTTDAQQAAPVELTESPLVAELYPAPETWPWTETTAIPADTLPHHNRDADAMLEHAVTACGLDTTTREALARPLHMIARRQLRAAAAAAVDGKAITSAEKLHRYVRQLGGIVETLETTDVKTDDAGKMDEVREAMATFLERRIAAWATAALATIGVQPLPVTPAAEDEPPADDDEGTTPDAQADEATTDAAGAPSEEPAEPEPTPQHSAEAEVAAELPPQPDPGPAPETDVAGYFRVLHGATSREDQATAVGLIVRNAAVTTEGPRDDGALEAVERHVADAVRDATNGHTLSFDELRAAVATGLTTFALEHPDATDLADELDAQIAAAGDARTFFALHDRQDVVPRRRRATETPAPAPGPEEDRVSEPATEAAVTDDVAPPTTDVIDTPRETPPVRRPESTEETAERPAAPRMRPGRVVESAETESEVVVAEITRVQGNLLAEARAIMRGTRATETAARDLLRLAEELQGTPDERRLAADLVDIRAALTMLTRIVDRVRNEHAEQPPQAD